MNKVGENMYKVVLFDLDGTLIDPRLGIINSVTYALNKYNIEVKDSSELLKFIGPPLVVSFETFYNFSKEKAIEATSFYREYYKDKGVNENVLYDGVKELLKKLHENNFIVGLATSKPEIFAKHILLHYDILKYFDIIAGATLDGNISSKEQVIELALSKLSNYSKNQIVMVGDRHFDINGASYHLLDSIGVLYGFGSKEELKEANATYIVDSIERIFEIVSKKDN